MMRVEPKVSELLGKIDWNYWNYLSSMASKQILFAGFEFSIDIILLVLFFDF